MNSINGNPGMCHYKAFGLGLHDLTIETAYNATDTEIVFNQPKSTHN